MDAMAYESVIRQGHQCGRFGVHGADADIYRRYELAAKRYEDALNGRTTSSTKTTEQLGVEAIYNSGVVAAHLSTTFAAVLKDENISPDDHEAIEGFMVRLHDFPSKAEIDDVINSAGALFVRMGLLAQ